MAFGQLNANHYEDDVASQPIIDQLRQLMVVEEDPSFTKDYYDLNKRAIPNAIRIRFKDGNCTDWVVEHYPIGHPRRREAGIPLLRDKFIHNIHQYYAEDQANKITHAFLGQNDWSQINMDEFYQLFSKRD